MIRALKALAWTLIRAWRRRHRDIPNEVRWHGARTPADAIVALAAWGRFAVERAPGSVAMTLGDGGAFHAALDQALAEQRTPFVTVGAIDDAAAFGGKIAVLLCVYDDAKRITDLATQLTHHPTLGEIPFEYAPGLDAEIQLFRTLDEYRETAFVSPSLLDVPSPYEIYRQSLQRFEQKTGFRDFLDLYQCLKSVERGGIVGEIAEFGSYRGHSGWLVAQSLRALDSRKQLFMFDTFAEFPPEAFGVDHAWSHTHDVNFEEVKAKFTDVPNTTLVRGEFTQTVPSHCPERLALAYVDCDSYRATRWLLDELLPGRISPGGIVICEDYGHPALLGNRVAIQEAMAGKSEYFQFLSEFSGLYLIVRR